MMTLARRLAQIALLASTLGTLGGCEIITNINRSKLVDAGSGAGTTTTKTGTTSTTTGTGGSPADGGTPCTTVSDCPGADTECQSRTCTSGECGVAYQPDGTALKAQPTGTCQKSVCDGKGGTTSIADDANLPVNNLQCTDHKCTSGVPSTPAFPAGTACTQNGGKVCDGSGQCVACTQGSDCSTGACSQHMCVAATCTDGIKDGTETDVDCGGSCAPCATGKTCGTSGDCQSDVCTAHACVAASCTDGVKNGTETDIDCGGTCPACGPGKTCNTGGDCKGGSCAVTCQPTCTDGVKDGAETDVDCGGTCSPCATGKACSVAGDCTSNLCIGGTCSGGATCNDGAKDGTETDVDCGGSCSPCITGKHCSINGDCSSAFCSGGTCTANLCSGVTCPSPDQCHVAGVCNPATGVCTNPTKSNGTSCNDGNACTDNDVCTGGTCGGTAYTCAAPDQCHQAGTCNGDGTCSFAAKSNGTVCNDGNACTQNDVCTGGTCGGTAYTCAAADQCHQAGTCNGDGTCSFAAKSNGTSCNDGNACTQNDVCTGGTCAGTAYTCAAADQCHQAGTCNGDGTCSFAAKSNGTGCNDGNACTKNDVCTGGTCGGTAYTCAAPDSCHQAGTCNGDGTCAFAAKSDGTVCGAGTCSSGTQTAPLTCSGGTCNAGGGTSSCGAYDCNAGNTACLTACGADTDCSSPTTTFCSNPGASGTCIAKLANGTACSGADQCTSGYCYGTPNTCQANSCGDGIQDGSETGVDCGGPTCPICPTVLVVGAGSASSFGAELNPTAGNNGTWSSTTSLGAPSVSDLGLTFIGSGASTQAVGVMRYTSVGDPLDQAVVYASWTAGAWAPFASIGSGQTTREVPAIASAGTSAFVGYQGTDFNMYFVSYNGTTWSSAEAVGAGGVPTPPGIAAVGGNATIAYFAGGNNATAQDRIGTWQTATTLDTVTSDQSFVATPSIVAMNGGTAELLTAFIRQSDGAILFATRTGGTWSSVAQVPGAAAPASSSYGPVERLGLAALPGGGAILAWRDATTTDIFYSTYAGGSWSAAPIAFSSPNISLAAAPALSHGVAGATAEIAFVESDGVAYHARLVGGTWTTPVGIGGTSLSHVTIASAP